MKQKSSFIAYVAGRSAGHIIPALTHADKERRSQLLLRVLFFSTNTALDRSLLERNPSVDVYKPLTLRDVPYKKIWLWPLFILQLIGTFVQSAYSLIRYRPSRLISMGGYISLPVAIVAWILRIPVEVYELNAVPGEAVKVLSYLASQTHVCFNESQKFFPARACCVTSNYPLRFTTDDRIERAEACQKLGIDPSRKIILVLGGSQGSRFINTLVTEYLIRCGGLHNYFVIHQTGASEIDCVVKAYSNTHTGALVFSYRSDIALCYAAADVIIARAGAGTLFEILFFGKPAVIIPLEASSTAHQKDNAYALQQVNPKLFKVVLQQDVAQNPLLFLNAFSQMIGEKA